MRKRLKQKLSSVSPIKCAGIYSSFDIVGDIAIIKMPGNYITCEQAVAKQIMATHRSVKAVLTQTSAVAGDFRVRKLRLLAGENRTTTKYREANCTFAVDLENCYFSPRLSYERLRVAKLVTNGETVVNMFSGVGCFSIIIAKTVPNVKLYSIDINPTAYECMQQNARLNRVYAKVFPIFGDAKSVIEGQLRGVADRVLMPLPEKVFEYLPVAVSALKKSGGWIHLYDFEHAVGSEEPAEKTEQKVAAKLDALGVGYEFAFSRVVRSIGPNWYQTVIDVHVA